MLLFPDARVYSEVEATSAWLSCPGMPTDYLRVKPAQWIRRLVISEVEVRVYLVRNRASWCRSLISSMLPLFLSLASSAIDETSFTFTDSSQFRQKNL